MSHILALAIATTILVLIPGPNVGLIVANSLQYGLRAGLVTAFGTTFGLALQLLAVVGGLAALIEVASFALTWIRWAGVAYLLYLAVKTWQEPLDTLVDVQPESNRIAFWRGAGFAVVNPKTLLFNAAFLPQFVAGGPNAVAELSVAAIVFLTVVIAGDAAWAVFAAMARKFLMRVSNVRNKITSIFLASAGLGLALARDDT